MAIRSTDARRRGWPARLRRRVSEFLDARRRRAGLQALLVVDDWLLRDVGLSRGQIAHLARLPRSADAIREMRRTLRG